MWEIWRNVKGFEGLYKVSTRGRVRSLPRYIKDSIGRTQRVRGKILKPFLTGDGYYAIALYLENGKSVQKAIHRIVAETFIPNPQNLPQVNHKNEVKTANEYRNLEWCSSEYNVNFGTAQRANNAKKRIVLQYAKNGMFIAEYESIHAAARATGAKHGNIYHCCTRKAKTAHGFIFKFKEAA